jgi:hypothetical protein
LRAPGFPGALFFADAEVRISREWEGIQKTENRIEEAEFCGL